MEAKRDAGCNGCTLFVLIVQHAELRLPERPLRPPAADYASREEMCSAFSPGSQKIRNRKSEIGIRSGF
jgi:hypothetical protein